MSAGIYIKFPPYNTDLIGKSGVSYKFKPYLFENPLNELAIGSRDLVYFAKLDKNNEIIEKFNLFITEDTSKLRDKVSKEIVEKHNLIYLVYTEFSDDLNFVFKDILGNTDLVFKDFRNLS